MNFFDFTSGLVDGHCIGVDSNYLTHKAEAVGHFEGVILAERRVNDEMGKYIARWLVIKMIKQNIPIQGAKVIGMGLTLKLFQICETQKSLMFYVS